LLEQQLLVILSHGGPRSTMRISRLGHATRQWPVHGLVSAPHLQDEDTILGHRIRAIPFSSFTACDLRIWMAQVMRTLALSRWDKRRKIPCQ
jgi:hypothetical protein